MIEASRVHEALARHQLVDGFHVVMDLEKSRGSFLVDAATGEEFLDFYTCFASWPIGYRHPRMEEPEFQRVLLEAATNNPANSDLYTTLMADFVDAFATRVTPPGFPYHFWVAGGALAVENALKAAFDWKARKLRVDDDGKSLCVLHFRKAFHGRSGYTMSLTNTERNKIDYFPKFDWPRAHNPAIEWDLDGRIANDVQSEEEWACGEIEEAFKQRGDRIAAIIIEPMQGEGGDNHFRPEFLSRLREYADARDALLVFDEIQTGFYGCGDAWMWQSKGVAPDIVAFGKKTQVCGLYSNERIDEVKDNVFHKSGRINSTWGGNLVDMVRCRRFIDIIQDERMAANVAEQGERFVDGLRAIGRERGGIANVRGQGSMVAFTLESPEVRQRMLADLRKKRLLALASGESAIRFRMPLNVSAQEVDMALERVEDCLPARVG